jgi:hypothetical protein
LNKTNRAGCNKPMVSSRKMSEALPFTPRHRLIKRP